MSKKRNRTLAEFYARYPYPAVKEIFFDRNLVAQHFYLAGLPPRSGGKLLVAGCGTTEALTWALSAPDFQVHGVDVSEPSIRIAERLAEQLGVKNLRLTHGDFEAGDGVSGKYDLISSLGVVHHLANPRKALRRLAKRLAPGGVLSLMVYTHTNRRTIQDAQRVIQHLTRGMDAERKEDCAVRICESGRHAGGRLAGTFERALEERLTNPPSFADTMLNPRETSYSIPELVDLLDDCDLELAAPVHPFAWIPYGHLDDEALGRLADLPLAARMEVADLLTNPLCWVVARRRADAAEPPASEGEAFWRQVPRPLDAGVYEVRSLEVRQPALPLQLQVERLDADTVLIARSAKYPARFHPLAAHLLALVDGVRDLESIGKTACEAEGLPFEELRADVALTLRTMMHDMTLFVPGHSPSTAAES